MKTIIILVTILAVLLTTFLWFAIPWAVQTFFTTQETQVIEEELQTEEPTLVYAFGSFPSLESFLGTPALPDFTTRPEATQFRTVIRNGAAEGPNFAGRYTVVSWECGTSCQTSAILEADTGKIIAYDITTSLGTEFKLDSRLLIANPLEDRVSDELPQVSADYYELQDGALLVIAKQYPGAEKPTACVEGITRARNLATQEVQEFPMSCDIPLNWQIVQ